MRTLFVKTSNYIRLNQALVALSKRGASEASLMILDGVPGLGKTTTMEHWVAQNQCPYLRAKWGWTANKFLNELLESFNVRPPHNSADKFATALREIGTRQSNATLVGRTFALVLDEADHFSSRAEVMETVRDISDMLELTVLFVGMGKIRDNLARFPQISSRVSQYVRFESATVEDVKLLVDGLCEIPVADDLIRFVHHASGGMNREVMEAIAKIEQHGRRLGDVEKPLTLAEMSGQHIMNDRVTRKEIRVPEYAQ